MTDRQTGERERDRDRDRQTDRQTDRQERERERQAGRQAGRQRTNKESHERVGVFANGCMASEAEQFNDYSPLSCPPVESVRTF